MANEGKQEGKPEERKQPQSEVRSIRETVAERIVASAPEVKDGVLKVLTDKEIRRRTDTVLKGLEMEDQQNKEIRKLEKADLITYDAEGNKTSENFSKQRVDELKKAKEKRDKLRKALENALVLEGTPDFQKLFELVGGGGKSDAGLETINE